MAGLVCKPVDFVFDTGAVARAHAFDLAGKHGAAVKAAANNVVRPVIGVRDPARDLRRMHACIATETEHRQFSRLTAGHAVTRLFRATAEVYASAINPWWGASFQTALRQLQFLESGRQTQGRRVTGTTSGVVFQTDMDFSIEKRASR